MEEKNSIVNHIMRQLSGAWEFIKLNPRAMEYFDVSAEAFWKSFWAIALVAPVFFLGLNVSPDLVVVEGVEISKTSRIIEYFLRLPLIALVMIFFTRFLKIDAYYSNMIIAFNWLWVLANYIILPISILISKELLPLEAGALVVMAVAIYLELYVTWFLFRQSLRISGWLAFGVMVFKALFTLTVFQIVVRAI